MVIKGVDLQNFYFLSTADAIQTRVGTAHDILYVLDGVVINDINAYSIYDIEEIIIIDNAIAGINSALANSVTAFVKTNRETKGLPALTVASKAGALSSRDNKDHQYLSAARETKSYQQYFIASRFSKEKWNAGVSLDYLREGYTGPSVSTYMDLDGFSGVTDQLRTRAFATYQIDGVHSLSAEVQWAPNRHDQEDRFSQTPGYTQHAAQDNRFGTLQSVLQLKSNFSQKLRNELSLAYQWYEYDHRYDRSSANMPQYHYQYGVGDKLYGRHLHVRDRLSYDAGIRENVRIIPAINIAYRSLHGGNRLTSYTVYEQAGYEGSHTYDGEEDRTFFNFTPSVDFMYKDVLNINTGAILELAKLDTEAPQRVYPYVSGSFDLWKALDAASRNSAQFFVSFAETPFLGDMPMNQWYYNEKFYDYYTVSNLNRLTYLNDRDARNNRLQIGARMTLAKAGVYVQYTFGQINYRMTEPAYAYTIGIFPMLTAWPSHWWQYYTTFDIRAPYHRAGIGKVFEGINWQWRTDLLFTRHTFKHLASYFDNQWDRATETKSSYWQWSNGITARRFFAGADMMLRSNEYYEDNNVTDPDKHIFNLQHIYAGYKVPLANRVDLDVYGYGRNLLENVHAIDTMYYGLGIRFAGW